MAGVLFSFVTAPTVTGTSLLTIIQLIAAAGLRVLIHEWSVSFIGTSNTAQPIQVDVIVQTTAGTASAAASSATGQPTKWNGSDQETVGTTARITFTVEPTKTTLLQTEEIHPQTGYTWQAPFGRPLVIPNGGRLGFQVTAPATTSVVVRGIGEE